MKSANAEVMIPKYMTMGRWVCHDLLANRSCQSGSCVCVQKIAVMEANKSMTNLSIDWDVAELALEPIAGKGVWAKSPQNTQHTFHGS